jgi:hypothetical protein
VNDPSAAYSSEQRPFTQVELHPAGIVAPPGFVLIPTLTLPEGFVKGAGMFDVEVCDDD